MLPEAAELLTRLYAPHNERYGHVCRVWQAQSADVWGGTSDTGIALSPAAHGAVQTCAERYACAAGRRRAQPGACPAAVQYPWRAIARNCGRLRLCLSQPPRMSGSADVGTFVCVCLHPQECLEAQLWAPASVFVSTAKNVWKRSITLCVPVNVQVGPPPVRQALSAVE
eukprot:352382-Chlamydomonas_euryale.AAC.2